MIYALIDTGTAANRLRTVSVHDPFRVLRSRAGHGLPGSWTAARLRIDIQRRWHVALRPIRPDDRSSTNSTDAPLRNRPRQSLKDKVSDPATAATTTAKYRLTFLLHVTLRTHVSASQAVTFSIDIRISAIRIRTFLSCRIVSKIPKKSIQISTNRSSFSMRCVRSSDRAGFFLRTPVGHTRQQYITRHDYWPIQSDLVYRIVSRDLYTVPPPPLPRDVQCLWRDQQGKNVCVCVDYPNR